MGAGAAAGGHMTWHPIETAPQEWMKRAERYFPVGSLPVRAFRGDGNTGFVLLYRDVTHDAITHWAWVELPES